MLKILLVAGIATANLIVLSPQDLVDKLNYTDINADGQKSIQASYATFGRTPYGQNITGQVYIDSDNPLGCTPLTFDNQEPPKDPSMSKVAVVMRGECNFMTKARNAENAGAMLLVIADHTSESITHIIMVDDGTDTGIQIPSMIIGKSSGKMLLDEANSTGSIVTLVAPFAPAKQAKKAKMQVWYSSNNQDALFFLEKFSVYMYTQLQDYLDFQPQAVVLPHLDWTAAEKARNCYEDGKYCAPVPRFYTNGTDILDEDMRQHCLYSKVWSDHDTDKWWDYMRYVANDCLLANEACSRQAHDEIEEEFEVTQSCVLKSKMNLLKHQADIWVKQGINEWPSVAINKALFVGKFQPLPVLTEICADLTVQPSVCLQTFKTKNLTIVEPELEDDEGWDEDVNRVPKNGNRVCEINKEAWLGSKFIKVEKDKSDRGIPCSYSRQNKNQYCLDCHNRAQKCYKMVGDSFISTDGNPVAHFDDGFMHLHWSANEDKGILWEDDACPELVAGCDLMFDGLYGKSFRTWDSKDPEKKTVETGTYIKNSDGKLCFKGTKSGLNCLTALDSFTFTTDRVTWVTARILPNGLIIWSHGYRQAPLTGTCAVPDLVPANSDKPVSVEPKNRPAAMKMPPCKVDWTSWSGVRATDFKGDKIVGKSVFARMAPNVWVVTYNKKKHRFVRKGNKLVYAKNNLVGELQKNGEILWNSDGMVSRLDDPCPKVESCAKDEVRMHNSKGRTWITWDTSRTTYEKYRTWRRGSRYCIKGTKTKTNCHQLVGNRLINEKVKWMWATIQPNGDLVWSNGFTSRPEKSPCQDCSVTWDDWVNQRGILFKSADPQEESVDHFVVKKSDIEGQYCFMGQDYSICAMKQGQGRLETVSKSWFFLEPNGNIKMDSGYELKMVGNICDQQRKKRDSLIEKALSMEGIYGIQHEKVSGKTMRTRVEDETTENMEEAMKWEQSQTWEAYANKGSN